jgi:Pyruvate/2-oxoacid:ferredoxin oxidoreductase gamma subunit
MSGMPGSYQQHDPFEVELAVTDEESYSPSAEGEWVNLLKSCQLHTTVLHDILLMEHAHTELELTIGNLANTSDESEDDEDGDYLDDNEVELYDADDLDIDEDFDEDGNYLGDPELAEAERLAAAAGVTGQETEDEDDQTETETEGEAEGDVNASNGTGGGGYTLAIDRKVPFC